MCKDTPLMGLNTLVKPSIAGCSTLENETFL